MDNIEQFLKFYEEDKSQQASPQSQDKTATQNNNTANNNTVSNNANNNTNNNTNTVDNDLKAAFELLKSKNLSSITNANTLLEALKKMKPEDVKSLMTSVYKAMGNKGNKKLNDFNAAFDAKTQEDARNGNTSSSAPTQAQQPAQQQAAQQQTTPTDQEAAVESAQIDQAEKATNVNISTVAQFVNELVKARQAKGNTTSKRFPKLKAASEVLSQLASEDKYRQTTKTAK